MYTMIIVDDEIKIQEGIKAFVKKNFSNISVVGCFEDGEDAIDFLKSNDADIVLSDVKMISVTGIEVAEYVYNNKNNSRVIILSGYPEFDYAKSAMKYNVKHFLVKPTDFKELKAAIEETISELDEYEEKKKQLINYKKYAHVLKEEFLTNLLMGAINDVSVATIEFVGLETGLEIKDCAFCVIDLLVENYHNYLSSRWNYGKDQLNQATKNLIEIQNTDKIFVFYVLCEDESNKLLAILPREGALSVSDRVEAHLKKISDFAKENLKVLFKFQIVNTYDTIDDMLSARDIDDISKNKQHQINLLISHINLGNYEEIAALTESIILRASHMNIQELQMYSYRLIVQIVDKIKTSVDDKIVYKKIFNSYDSKNIIDILCQEFMNISKQIENIEDENLVINRVKEYINKHFNEDVSLQDVADNVYMSRAYFSRYFKKMTGKNFTTYVTETRINHAKVLLLNGASTSETAKKCGYPNVRYFTQIFKNYVGVLPKEYRLLHSANKGDE